MDPDEIAQLEQVAEIHEMTDSTSERMRVLCQLAESLDRDEIQSLRSEASDAYNFPSLSSMGRAEAGVIMDRIDAVEDFIEDLEEVQGDQR